MKKDKKKKNKARRVFFGLLASIFIISTSISAILGFTNYTHNQVIWESYSNLDEYGCINNQHQMQDFNFGFSGMNTNGCGSIALFNLLAIANKDVSFPDIVKAMDFFGQNAFGFLGTNPISMVFYLRYQGIETYISFNPNDFDTLASTSPASIYGYLSLHGGHYQTIHPLNHGDYIMHNPRQQKNMDEILEDTESYPVKFLIYTKF